MAAAPAPDQLEAPGQRQGQGQRPNPLLPDLACDDPNRLVILACDRPPLTYGRLQTHLEHSAARLGELGIGPGDRVALVACLDEVQECEVPG